MLGGKGKMDQGLQGGEGARERRQTPRYAFSASAEIVEKATGKRTYAKVTEIGLFGCYVEIENYLPSGSRVTVKLYTTADFFEAEATVVYSRPDSGVGLAFREVKPHFVPTLQGWLLKAMTEPIEVKSK